MYQSKSVLIIDDSPIIQSATRLVLQRCGFKPNLIVSASSAADAVRMCQTRRFDILLVDFNLGLGSTGLQLLERLRRDNMLSHNPLLFVITAEESLSVVMGFAEFEPTDYLVKPLRPDMMQQRLMAAFHQHDLDASVITSYRNGGIPAVRETLKLAKTPDAFKKSATMLAKYMVRKGERPAAISMLQSFIQKHDYLPAKTLLADLLMGEKRLPEAEIVIDALWAQNNKSISVMDLNARKAIQEGKASSAFVTLQQAHQSCPYNLTRLFCLIWLGQTLYLSNEADKYVLEAAATLHKSVWNLPDYYCLLAAVMLEGQLVKEQPTEIWLRLSQQKAISPQERPFFNIVRAHNSAIQGNQLAAYRFLIATKSEEAKDITQQSFEFHFVSYQTCCHLGMFQGMRSAMSALSKLATEEQNATLKTIKQCWVKQEVARLRTNEKYDEAMAFYRDKQFRMAARKIISIWPDNRFDITLARCIVALACQKILTPEHHSTLITEARWTFEARHTLPDWYQALVQKYDLLKQPLGLHPTGDAIA